MCARENLCVKIDLTSVKYLEFSTEPTELININIY